MTSYKNTMHTNWMIEICKRSETGPYMKEKEFELKLINRTRELVNEYGIKFDRNVPLPSSDDLADRVFEAGLQLFLDVGVYNQTSERVIHFSREEIVSALEYAPSAVLLGEGRDAVVMAHRHIGDPRRPVVHSGPTGTPCSEKYHPLILLSCAQEPLVDCLGAGSVSTYLGERIRPGTPLELLGARRDAAVAREAVRMAGRPGMHINDVAVPLTAAGKMICSDPGSGLRPSDGRLISQMVEMKTDYDELSRVVFMQDYSTHIVDLMTPLIGGLGGGAEGTSVVTVACHLLGVICYNASYHMMSHTHLKWLNNTDRMGLWMQGAVGQALARNTHIVTLNDIYTVSGPGTKELLYECAAGAIAGTVSGFNMQGAGCTGGSERDHYTGLEARFIAECSRAALKYSREEANELLLKLLEKYEHTFNTPNKGYPFPEVYDEVAVQPKENWLCCYYEVKEELARELGLEFAL